MKVVRWLLPLAVFMAVELAREYTVLTAMGVNPGEGLRNVLDDFDRRCGDGNQGA